MAAVVGFAFLVTVVTSVGKRVFLFVVTTITNAMLCMTTTAGMGQKAAVGRSKSPPLAVKNNSLCYSIYMTLPIENKVISFCTGVSRTFFTANGGFLPFVAFLPAIRQARMGVLGNIREPALKILSDTHGRVGQSPEKAQIFFCRLL